jgi:predicted nucleic acid-binding protein
VPVTVGLHRQGVRTARNYGYRICDSLMPAAAPEALCTIFYSEDMHDGQKIAGMTIRNPF